MLGRWLVAVLLCLPAPALAAWTKATSTNFIVYSEAKPVDVVAFTQKLERFDSLLRVVTGAKGEPSPNRLTVFVVRNADTVQTLLGGKSGNVVGFYRPGVAGTTAVVPRFAGDNDSTALDAQKVLFHEYAHHFMLHYFATAYPAWYVEGFAEYFSTVDFRKDGTVAVGLPAVHRFSSLAATPDYDIRRLLTGLGPSGESDTSAFYAYSWLLTHYLRFAPARSGQLDAYLRAFAGGAAPEKAAEAFGDGRRLDLDVSAYIRSNRLSYSFYKGFDPKPPQVATVDIDATTAELMPLFMRIALGVDRRGGAAGFAGAARKALEKFPDSSLALELVAEGELATGALAAADTANDRLIAVRPADARALLRRARIAAARAKDDTSIETWRKIRGLVVAANRAEADDAFILSEFYRGYARARQRPSDAAVEGLRRALFLVPQARDLRFALASYLLATGSKSEGRAVLTPLLNDPHSKEARERARAMIEGRPVPENEADD